MIVNVTGGRALGLLRKGYGFDPRNPQTDEQMYRLTHTRSHG